MYRHLPDVARLVDGLSVLITAGIFEAHLSITDKAPKKIALGNLLAVWSFQDGRNLKSPEFDSLYDSVR